MTVSRMTVEAWPVTDPGQAELNEDSVLVYQPEDPQEAFTSGSLYVVADGQGVGSRGQIAGRYAAQKVMSAFYSSHEPDLGLRLRLAVEATNADLYAYAQTQPELVKMGATLIAAVARGEQLHIASVGNNRAYLIREGEIEQVTRDHTLVQQLLDEGAIVPEEARDHPRRDVVLRTLGAQPDVTVDVFDLRLKPDDALLLCTDGLIGYLHEDEIAQIVHGSSPRQAAETLVQKTTDRGGKDNVTAVAMLVRDGAPPLETNVPYTWDGTPPSFDEQPTLAMPRPDLPPPPAEEHPTIASDETVQMRPVVPPPPGEPVPAPPYQTAVQPAPQHSVPQQPGRPGRGVPADQTAPGTMIDPVTGLPPVPVQAGQPAVPQQAGYAPRTYQAPAQPNVSLQQQRRGVSVGLFAAVGLLAVILTALMVIVLVNPLGWELPSVAGADRQATRAAEAFALAATQTAAAEPPATPQPEPTPQPPPSEPTPEPTPEMVAPVGMVLVEGGAFMRGASEEEVAAAAAFCVQESQQADQDCILSFFQDAEPFEEVTLSPFFIDVTEVTNQAYAECVASGVCSSPTNTEFFDDPAFSQHPVVYVTWSQATQYCDWRGRRLPTEAEWEKAAGWDPEAGDRYRFPWGNDWEAGRANTQAAGLGGLSAVQAFPADLSPSGVLGMAGNASEWVQDWYYPNYEDLGTLNPARLGPQPLTEPFRVVRGGSFLELGAFARTAHRLTVSAELSASWVSFRCVADVAGAEPPAGTDEGDEAEEAVPLEEEAPEGETPSGTTEETPVDEGTAEPAP